MIGRAVSEVIPRLSAEIHRRKDYRGKGTKKGQSRLLVQVLHRCCAEDDEESHPQCGALKWDDFVRLALFCFIVGFEDHGIKEEGDEAENEEQLDEKDGQVFRVVLNPGTSL